MVRHITHHREYWFCRNCWQEMPDLSIATEKNSPVKSQLINLSVSSIKLDRALPTFLTPKAIGKAKKPTGSRFEPGVGSVREHDSVW